MEYLPKKMTLTAAQIFRFTLFLAAASGIGCEPVAAKLPPPTPGAAEITLESVPPGAAMSVDGIPVGNAPKTVKLNPGPHTAKALMSGYFASEQRFSVSRKKAETKELHLVASH